MKRLQRTVYFNEKNAKTIKALEALGLKLNLTEVIDKAVEKHFDELIATQKLVLVLE